MDRPSLPRPLFETDRITWTPDRLARRIAENEALIARLGNHPDDHDYRWIRTILVDDLDAKRQLLDRLRE